MAYQQQVNLGVAGGVPGQAATPGQSIYTAKTYVAAPEYKGADFSVISKTHSGVKAGTFVWPVPLASITGGITAIGGEYPNNCDQWGISSGVASKVHNGTDLSLAYVTNEMQKVGDDPKLPLGLVERVVDVPNYDVLTGYSDVVPPYGAVTIAVKGDYFVKLASCFNSAGAAATSVSAGATVYAGPCGEVCAAADSANAAMASAGYAETSFRVVDAGSAGDVVLITNWTIG